MARAGLIRRRHRPPPPTISTSCELPRPAARAPWAYVKVAEGCDRICGFCAIPSFRGKQRSRPPRTSWPRWTRRDDPQTVPLRCARSSSSPRTSPPTAVTAPAPGGSVRIANGPSPIASLTRAVSMRVERTRLLYLYPSGLTDELIETILYTGVPYFDLSLQHVARRCSPRMRRWGDGERFLRRIADIRAADSDATFRSSFILGYPGETERDHDQLLGSWRRRSSIGPASFPSPTRTARTPPGSPTRSRPSSRWSACASAPSSRTPSPRPSGTASSVPFAGSSSTPPAVAARRTRRPRSTASCTCRPTSRWAASSTCVSPAPRDRTCAAFRPATAARHPSA